MDAAPGADEFYHRAVQMYGSGNYAGAVDQMARYLELAPGQPVQSGAARERAGLLILRAGLQRGEWEQVRRGADIFVQESAGSPLLPLARLLKAEACFHASDYREAVQIYSTLPLETFAPLDSAQGRYHYGVALTELGLFREARSEFAALTGDSLWVGRTQFYLGYIDYVEGEYAKALRRFNALAPEVAHEQGATFFIAQILFAQRQYSKVLDSKEAMLEAARRLERGNHDHEAEAQRLIGESAYALSDKAQARTALESHAKLHPQGGRASARYLLGIMAYDEADYSKAADWLQPVADEEDAIGQSSNLYLGQVAARRGDNTSAAIYFDRAAHQPYDSKVAETSLYNYAAAVAGGGRVPFGRASTLLEEFGARYPDSKYAPAVDEYLALGYFAEKRYLKALNKLEKIKAPSAQVKTLMRQALYELGAGELSASQPAQAEHYLRRGAEYGGTDETALATRLWLAEALSAQGKYADAAKEYRRFLDAAPRNDTNRAQALYDMGYALYNSGDFNACRTAMQDAVKVKGAGALPANLRSDALLRAADCDNYLGNVKAALASYRQAATEQGSTGPDYAALQAACMEGLLGHPEAKKTGLQAMFARWPESAWAGQALYELVSVQIDTDDIPAALTTLNRLEEAAPNSRLLREATLDVASAYYVQGQEDKSVELLKHIVRTWPTSSQALTASGKLQDHYSRNGLLSTYMAFIDSVPGAPRPEASQMDYLSYVNAVSALDTNPTGTAPLEAYLRDYPQGRYRPDIMYALAGIYRDTRNSDSALSMLQQLLDSYSHSDAATGALCMKAEILQARGDNRQAGQAYLDLLARGDSSYLADAYRGLAFTASDPDKALEYVDKYLSLNAQNEQEISQGNKLKADLLQRAGRTAEAIELLKTMAGDTYTASGGEAAVTLARLYMQQGNNAEAIKLMTAFTDGGCSDLDTLARGYVTMADAFAASGDKRRALLYLESLSENYPGDNPEILSLISNGLKQYK